VTKNTLISKYQKQFKRSVDSILSKNYRVNKITI
jgi:hypothetical protein